MAQREARFLRILRIYNTVYYIFCAAMTAVYLAKGDIYHLLISAGTLLVPPALALLHRLLRLRRSSQMDLMIMGFVTLAYPLGACVDLYRRLPGFDKLAHGLSGVFVTVLCVLLFIQLKPDHTIAPSDVPMAMAFAFFGSLAVAGLWEVGEYILSGIVKIDLQRVLATGVSDSMRDIMICLAGTLATLPMIPRLAAGKDGVLTSPVRAFSALNA